MRRIALALILTALIGAACSTASSPGRQGSGRTPSASSTTLARPGSTSTTTTSSPSALDTLGPYLLRVAAVDAALKKAAAAVNGDVGAGTLDLRPATKAAIEAASPSGAGDAIPAGVPANLLGRVMLVQSDLVSRWASLVGYSRIGGIAPVARTDPAAADALACLSRGGTAASSNAADVRALTTTAAGMPSLTPLASESRDAADVRLLLSYLEGQNLGCASCGGYRYTTLPVITWYPVPRPATADYPQQADGTIGPSGSTGPEFSATWSPSAGWQVTIYAC